MERLDFSQMALGAGFRPANPDVPADLVQKLLKERPKGVAGLAVIWAGWNGAASYNDLRKQFPYLISGGVTGLALVIIGVGLMVGMLAALAASTVLFADATFGSPSASVEWTIWRWRFESSTTSASEKSARDSASARARPTDHGSRSMTRISI